MWSWIWPITGVWGQIWGEGTVRSPVGFSLLIPPSRIQTRGKFTFTRCAANWEEKKEKWFSGFTRSAGPLHGFNMHNGNNIITQLQVSIALCKLSCMFVSEYTQDKNWLRRKLWGENYKDYFCQVWTCLQLTQKLTFSYLIE